MDLFWVALAVYYAAACVFTFFLFGLDKWKAKRNAWRVPEATLIAFCAAGGALGGFAAMRLFRHKTKHRKFTVSVPILLILHLILIGVLAWILLF